MVNASEVTILKEVLELLQPWADVTTELGAEKNVTGSKIIPITYCLRKAISKLAPKTPIACSLKQSLKDSLHKRLHSAEQNTMLSVATFLDPRFKTDNFENALNISKVISAVQNEISRRGAGSSAIEELDLPKETNRNENMSVNMEITLYRNEPANMDMNPLEYWQNEGGKKFSRLKMVALDFLVILATSVPSESLFSKAGQILEEQRTRLKPKHLEKLLFLNSVDKDLWFSM